VRCACSRVAGPALRTKPFHRWLVAHQLARGVAPSDRWSARNKSARHRMKCASGRSEAAAAAAAAAAADTVAAAEAMAAAAAAAAGMIAATVGAATRVRCAQCELLDHKAFHAVTCAGGGGYDRGGYDRGGYDRGGYDRGGHRGRSRSPPRTMQNHAPACMHCACPPHHTSLLLDSARPSQSLTTVFPAARLIRAPLPVQIVRSAPLLSIVGSAVRAQYAGLASCRPEKMQCFRIMVDIALHGVFTRAVSLVGPMGHHTRITLHAPSRRCHRRSPCRWGVSRHPPRALP
jgi:hypothetical protein